MCSMFFILAFSCANQHPARACWAARLLIIEHTRCMIKETQLA